MKRKFFSFILIICFIIPCAIMLTACFGNDNTGEENVPTCEHNFEITDKPETTHAGKANCTNCELSVELPILNETNYVATGDEDYKVYSYTKHNKTFKFVVSKFSFVFDGTGYEISGYSGVKADVVIPESVIGDMGERSVTGIGNEAFDSRIDITSVTLPNSVKVIGANAFNACVNLNSVNLPEGLKVIESGAFKSCLVQNIVIPDSVTEIKEDAFRGCVSLEELVIGNGLTEIKASTFEGCSSLKKVTIGNAVQNIRENSFAGCTLLSAIHFGTSVKFVYDDAFKDCVSLEKIVLPISVEHVDNFAFRDCFNLDTVAFMGNERNCNFINSFDGTDGKINSNIYYYSENEPTPYSCVYEIGSLNLWHYDNEGNVDIWTVELTNIALNKYFKYSSTEVTITDEQWLNLQSVNLAEIFWWWNTEQLELLESSSTKEEYIRKLEAYGESIQGFEFNNNVDDKRVIFGGMNSPYIEIDGVVCVQGHGYVRMVIFNQDATEIYFEIENEYMTIKNIYTLFVFED